MRTKKAKSEGEQEYNTVVGTPRVSISNKSTKTFGLFVKRKTSNIETLNSFDKKCKSAREFTFPRSLNSHSEHNKVKETENEEEGEVLRQTAPAATELRTRKEESFQKQLVFNKVTAYQKQQMQQYLTLLQQPSTMVQLA